MSKPKRLKMVSPRGVAVFPRLNEPDTKFKAGGEYTVKLAFDENDAELLALVETLTELRDTEFTAWASENPKKKRTAKPADIAKEEVDDEGEPTGRLCLNFKMTASGVAKASGKPFTMKPTIVDTKKNVLKNPPSIGGGSVLKVAFEPSFYFVESSKEYGISCRLNGVQIIELVEFGGHSAESMGFGEEDEGYEADEEQTNAAPAGTSDEGDGEDF